MLLDSMSHAKDDVAARNLREQQVEADRVVLAMEAALQVDGDRLLSEDELHDLNEKLNYLKDVKTGDDHIKIKNAISDLNQASMDFAGRRMNESIQSAMAGHKVEDFN